MTALIARIQNALAGDDGDVNFSGGVGLFAFVVVVLFVAWLMVKAGIIVIP